jgi:F-type H+-transporting ATPase subunit delta
MSELRVASRYAKAIIDLAIERNELEQVKTDIDLFLAAAKVSSELVAVLKNPIVPIDKKNKILSDLFSSRVSKTTESFFDIVVNKGRAEVLHGTAKEFLNQYNEKKGFIKAKVTSATALNDAAEKEIISIVEKATSKKVILEKVVDSKLIGGFVLTVGDKQFDSSIAKSLNNLKKSFSSNVGIV